MHRSEHLADRFVDRLSERADQVASGLLDRTLPKSEWTHEGHLLACIAMVRRHGAADALAVMRAAIPPYNEATGVANTSTGGYHETITVYYVWAIGRLLADGLAFAAILGHPLVDRTGPLVFWDRDVLMSPAARATWTPPQRAAADGSSPSDRL